ncbi:acyl-CoA dehydrogenase family protein [Polaromonas sp.]|uniref:acyl-CoA dehydrogenase family protein n=1 Tax=Polaromonas sp. TaxID=1869339 RepID=UPI00352BCFA4
MTNILYSSVEERFAGEVTAFLDKSLPKDISTKVFEHLRLEKADYMTWQSILAAKGWLAANWPVAFGGQGWSAMQTHIFDELCAIHGAPRLVPFGLRMVAPVIMKFGTPEQIEKWLPPIRNNEVWWCQGYSEPNAGSDLASLQTRAENRGDHYIVNGQKTWTTQAQYADMMFCLVRTEADVKKQEGISFLLIDMRSKGVTVRPIQTYDGEVAVNEVFLDNVEVPIGNRIGREGEGWTCAKFLLGHERTVLARVGDSKREIATLKKVIARCDPREVAPWRAHVNRRLALLEIELAGLEVTLLRALTTEKVAGPETSVLKIVGTQIQQDISELLLEVAGPDSLPFDPAWKSLTGRLEAEGNSFSGPIASNFLDLRKLSIFGGTNEIQRNIIAQRVLGL